MSTNRRQFLGSVAAAAGASLLPTALFAQNRQRRNVLFIVADDLNRALGCYGHPVVKSPNLDRLARRGVVFGNAQCQYPLCQPSRVSFLSGMRPDTTKVWTLQTPTREHLRDHVFLPEHFRNQGYFTAISGKVYHTGDHAEDPRSWEVESREFGKSPKPEEILEGAEAEGPKGHSFSWASLKTPDEQTPDGIVARRAVEYMERALREKRPFFVGAGFRRPHSPYAAPKKYFDMYALDSLPLLRTPLGHFSRLLPAAVNHDPPEKPLSDTVVRQFLRAYYASTSFMDAQAGVLFDALDRLKLWDNTVVVFVSDNGYHLGDHGGLWHKNTLFDQSLRLPLLAWAPGMKAGGKRCDRIVELVDIYPTLAALCGLPAVNGLEGYSFAPLLDDPGRAWKKAGFSMQGRGKEAARDIEYFGRSVRTERWRYTEWDEARKGVELYDHSRDPDELENLAGSPQHKAAAAELRRLLHAGWKAALPT